MLEICVMLNLGEQKLCVPIFKVPESSADSVMDQLQKDNPHNEFCIANEE